MIRAVSYLSEVNSCSFVQPVHILHLVVTLGCFRGRKKKQRSICFQAAWTVHCFAPRFTFLFLARQTGAFLFPLRPSYDKVLCGLYVAMYYSTFLLFIYLFILTADGFKPPLSNNPPHRQYRKMLPQQRWKQHKSPYFKPFSAHFRKWACIKDGF